MNEDCFQLGAKALIVRPDGKMLLLKKSKEAVLDWWDLPGGRMHRNECIEYALRREVQEETGLSDLGEVTPLMMVQTNIRIPVGESDVGLIFSVFICQINESSPVILLSGEHVCYEWVSPQEAENMLAPNHPVKLTRAVGQLGKVFVTQQ